MRPHFHCNPAPRHGAEHLRYGFFGASDASFQHHFALFVQHAIAAALISRSRPIVTGPVCRRDFWPVRLTFLLILFARLLGLCSGMLFFFMVGSFLHFECAHIGSLSHPAGSRPSHPISETQPMSTEAF